MSTKKGIIGKEGEKWVIAESCDINNSDFIYNDLCYRNAIPIHSSSLPTILSNGSLKPEYHGEVEYEIENAKCDGRLESAPAHDCRQCVKCGCLTTDFSCETTTQYAIPKPVESKGDVWEVAMRDANDYAWKKVNENGWHGDVSAIHQKYTTEYLKQHYTLTKNK